MSKANLDFKCSLEATGQEAAKWSNEGAEES